MRFPFRIQFIAVIQVVLTAFLTYFFVTHEYRALSNQNVTTLEAFLVDQKQQELKNYTAIAKASIEHIYAAAAFDDEIAKKKVADILSTLIYNGHDGYFFVYDDKGTNIVLPTEPYRAGQNYWNITNDRGEKTIQILIENAKNGGDFYRYPWNQPSTETITEKLSYSDFLPKWGWMMGTGVYLDNVKQQLATVQQAIDTHIQNTRFIILLIALTSIFAIFGVGAIIQFTQKRQTDAKINQLGQRIVALQEEEQRHISRELHDGIVQVLVSIKYSLEATGRHLSSLSVEKPTPLVKAEENLNSAINEIRRISHHLHPRILDELGLSEAMESLAKEFSERTGIDVSIDKPALRKLLTDEINTTLYRVLQECMINVEKHAQASKMHIELSIKNNWLTLSIADNGIGMSQAAINGRADGKAEGKTTRGIGTRNMAERVEYHKGKFIIESDSTGTTIIAKIPRSVFANHYLQQNEESMHKEVV